MVSSTTFAFLACALVVFAGCFAEAYTGSRCISSCAGKTYGKYQSCKNCHVYVTCTGGQFMDGWPCPSGKFWDDDEKNCLDKSSTCTEEQEQEETENTEGCYCASSCDGLADGKYQSCSGCNVYVRCGNGQIQDDLPCPRYSYYDDIYKRCLFRSSTCGPQCDGKARPYPPGSTDRPTRPPRTRPTRQPTGLPTNDSSGEQDQQTRKQWPTWPVWPTRPAFTSRRPYPTWPVWPTRQHGTPTPNPPNPSTSGSVCGCVRDCDGKEDGSYPSCVGCRYFAICFRGKIYDSQECPGTKVWHDEIKSCVDDQDLCKTDCQTGVPTTEAPQESEESEESEEDTNDTEEDSDSDEEQKSEGSSESSESKSDSSESRSNSSESNSSESNSSESDSSESNSSESNSSENDSSENTKAPKPEPTKNPSAPRPKPEGGPRPEPEGWPRKIPGYGRGRYFGRGRGHGRYYGWKRRGHGHRGYYRGGYRRH